ncbi:MAG: amino acid ABC transporter substrate-binding protein [Candidatus Bathyarchaeia archaeon]
MFRKAVSKMTVVMLITVIIVVAAIGGGLYYYFTQVFKPEKNEILVGVSLALTGTYAAPSQRQLWGFLMWIEDVNAEGGIYVKEYNKKLPVRFVYYDDRGDSATAVKLYERLITVDNVDFLFGPYGSGITLATAPVAEKYKKLMLSQMAAADTIPAQNYSYVFTTLAVASQFGLSRKALLDYLTKDLGYGIETFGVVTSSELYPLTVARSTIKLLEDAGYTKVLYEEYPKGLTDFSAILTKAKDANPDFLYFVCYPADSYVILRQLQAIDYKPKLLMFDDGPNDPAFVQAFGTVAEGILTQMSWHWEAPFPLASNFTERFKARYGEYPRHWSALPYAAGQVLKMAIEKAGTLDTEKVRSVLLTENFTSTIYGNIKFGDWVNPQGQKLQQINLNAVNFVLQIQNGVLKIIAPKQYKSADPIFPYPGW